MRRFRLPVVVFVGLAALELGVLAFVDTTTDPLDRAGKPFQLRNIPSGAAITQRLEVGADGLDEIRLDGEMTPGRGAAVLNAQLVEVEDNGTAVGVVRSASVELAPAATACCVIRFEPIRDSRWRAYRLDVNVGDLNGRQLSLTAVPGPVTGRLTINGRRQTAFLAFRTKAAEGTGLARLRMTSPATHPDAGGARVDLQRGHRRRRTSAG